MKIELSVKNRLVPILWLALLCSPQLGWTVTKTWIPSAPLADSPDKKGNQLTIRLQFADPNNKGQVMTQDITINVAGWDPTKETWIQAQNRKAKAIADAITNAKLNGVKAKLNQTFVQQFNPITKKWVKVQGASSVVIDGLTVDPKNRKDPVWLRVKDPTREPGNGVGGKLPQKGGGAPYEGSMGGTRAGMSTGTDPTGSPSLFAFGFYTANGNTTDIAVLSGASGLTASQILGDLASQFNSLYSQSGLTADYNTTTDSLTFDQSLNGNQIFFEADTDTGIDFTMQVDAGTPEPTSLFLLGSGFLSVGCFLRKRAIA
jgi:hypothetical protein